jgi:hypothetical protein
MNALIASWTILLARNYSDIIHPDLFVYIKCSSHRVYTVPGFLCSRPNWVPRPLTCKQVLPPPFCSRGDTLAGGERGGGSQFGRGDRHSGTLVIVSIIPLYGSSQQGFILSFHFAIFRPCTDIFWFWGETKLNLSTKLAGQLFLITHIYMLNSLQ